MTGLGKAFGGFLEAPTLADELQQMTVMHEPIKKRRNDDDIAAQYFAPVFDFAV